MYEFLIKGTPSKIMATVNKMVEEDEFQTYQKRQAEADDRDRDYSLEN